MPQNIPFERIVIWGLRKRYHTHRHIHKAFYDNAIALGYKAIWVEDEPSQTHHIKAGDLVIASEVFGKMVPKKKTFEDYNIPIKDGVYYCLHGFQAIFSDRLKKDRWISLQVYTDEAGKSSERWGPVTFFDKPTRTLYQPWGTNILAHKFSKPTWNKHKTIFWVGSVWNNASNQGNINVIAKFEKEVTRIGLRFYAVRFVPEWANKLFVRYSRLAPAIAGEWQVDKNYLPCRMFKNISFGHVGFSNVRKFDEILGKYAVTGTVEEMTKKVLALSKDEYLALASNQQNIIKSYTYKQSIENIIRAFGMINKKIK